MHTGICAPVLCGNHPSLVWSAFHCPDLPRVASIDLESRPASGKAACQKQEAGASQNGDGVAGATADAVGSITHGFCLLPNIPHPFGVSLTCSHPATRRTANTFSDGETFPCR